MQLELRDNGAVFVDGHELDVASWTRESTPAPGSLRPASALAVFHHLASSWELRHLVVGVIGPREAESEQLDTAYTVGEVLGAIGLTLICGGHGGVMQAVSRGCSTASGLMIGLLPGSSADLANPFVTVPLPTGLGEARNMIIAKSARVLVAIGSSYGTLSEVAYGLHFGKPVIGVQSAPQVEGVTHVHDAQAAIEHALQALLATAPVRAA